MYDVTVQLSIGGNSTDIQKFMHEFKTFRKEDTSPFYPLCYHKNLSFSHTDHSCDAEFKIIYPPSKEGLDNLRARYPSFHIYTVWYYTDIRGLGFIENDGTEYRVDSIDELKRALMMYTKR